jgi:hypothetical protein
LRVVRLTVLALLVVLLAALLLCGWRTYRHVRQLEAHVAALRTLSLDTLPSLRPGLQQLRDDLTVLRADLAWPLALAPHLGWVPRYGPTLAAAPDLLAAGEMLLDTASLGWDVLEPVVGSLVADTPSGQPLQQLARSVDEHRAALVAARVATQETIVRLEQIDLEGLDPRVADRLRQFLGLTPWVGPGMDGLLTLPAALAAQPDQTWLLLAQNNEELRATGGFISSIAVLRLQDGLPKLSSFRDSYRVEDWDQPHPDPPEPLREYMLLDLWTTRDGNWWPDFPTSARAVAELYELNQGERVDGVIAVDLVAAERLLEALTPLKLGDGTTLRPGRVGDTFRASWSLPPDALITGGDLITATAAYQAIDVELVYAGQTASVCLDQVYVGPAAHDENWVSNPSFERDSDGDGWPDTWLAKERGPEDGLEARAPYDGAVSLRVHGDPDVAKSVHQRLDVQGTAGHVLRVAAMARADGPAAPEGAYLLRVTLIGDSGNVEHAFAYPVLAHDWATSGTAAVVGRWWRHRKDIIGQAVSAAMGKAATQPDAIDWQGVAAALWGALGERHVQCFSALPDAQAYLVRQGWAGQLAETAGDYLLLVDANMGYNKVTANVEQALRYQVTLEPEPVARLTVSYHNASPAVDAPCDKFLGQNYVPTYEVMAQGCYYDYVRLYVPLGCELVALSGGDAPLTTWEEQGKTVYATYFELAPGATRELVFYYRLPATVTTAKRYQLLVQKQGGTVALPLQVTLQGPQGLMVTPPGETERSVAAGLWTITSDLRVDRQFGARWP